MGYLKQIPNTALTSNDTTSQEELGQIRIESDGKEYRYVRNSATSSTSVKGDILKLLTCNNYQVTRSAGAVRFKNNFVGVGIGRISRNNYGWVQCRGYGNYLYTDGAVVAGDSIIVQSTTQRVCRRLSTAYAITVPFGRTGRADSGSILTSYMLGTF